MSDDFGGEGYDIPGGDDDFADFNEYLDNAEMADKELINQAASIDDAEREERTLRNHITITNQATCMGG